MQDVNELAKFTDNRGREWHPKLKLRHIADLEVRRGISFFPIALDLGVAMGKLKAGASEDEIASVILTYGKKLVGNIGDTARLLYDGLKDSSQRVTYKGEEITYEDFFAGLDETNILQAMFCSVFAIIAFFPKGDETDEDRTGGGARPFAEEVERIAGSMFTDLQETPV
jgi:hypothetical protein